MRGARASFAATRADSPSNLDNCGNDSVDRLPFPVGADQFVDVCQVRCSHRGEDAGPEPLLKAVVRRRTGAQFA